MDTRSSSGSGSRSAANTDLSLNLDLNQDGRRAAQHATYTTAGTIYNPQTVQLLQPPARRGRALRWPPAFPADLSAFNSSVLGAFPHPRYRSPPTTASTLRHYSPLQQNQDRAIDPRISTDNNHYRPVTSLSNPRRSASGGSSNMSFPLSNALPRELLADEPPNSIICHDCGDRFRNMANAEFHTTLSGHDKFSRASDNNNSNGPDGDSGLQNMETKGEEEENLTQFNNYSVKTLTNLASYPNPNQKMAQRCLDRARETFKAAAENSRPVSPNSSRPGFNGVGTSSSSYLSGDGRESSEYYSRVPRNSHVNSSTRSSVLSSGPGAPQPLTAGPPGQRHYKASTLEGPLRALQESASNPYSLSAAESLFGTQPLNPSALSYLPRSLSTKTSEASRTVQRELQSMRPLGDRSSPHPAAQVPFAVNQVASETAYREELVPHGPTLRCNQKDVWQNRIRETKTKDELGAYYRDSRGGIPHDYDPSRLVSVPGDNSDLQPPPGRRLPSSFQAQSQRNIDLARHRQRFYAGDSQMFRPWESRFDEILNKARDWELGLLDERGPLTRAQIEAAVDPAQLGKPRNISVNLINQLQTHDAARPLLPMLYSTLANYKKDHTRFEMVQKLEKDDGRGCPRPGYIGQERQERMRGNVHWSHPKNPSRGGGPSAQ